MYIVCWIKKNRYLRDKKRNGTWCIWINFTKKPWSGRWGKLPNQRNRRWALSPLLPIWRRTSRRQRQCKTLRGGTTHSNLTQLLGISPSRVSEYLSGKSEPTLKIGREISRKLHIDANIVLGVWTTPHYGGYSLSAVSWVSGFVTRKKFLHSNRFGRLCVAQWKIILLSDKTRIVPQISARLSFCR